MAEPELGISLKGRQILVVEDDLLLAMHLEQILENEGCTILGPTPKLAKALAMLETEHPDAAILDLNLNGDRPVALAEALMQLKVPFVIVSGYARSEAEEPIVRGARRLEKPINPQELIHALTAVIASTVDTA
jgi:CheY-like chemotaxis protein